MSVNHPSYRLALVVLHVLVNHYLANLSAAGDLALVILSVVLEIGVAMVFAKHEDNPVALHLVVVLLVGTVMVWAVVVLVAAI